MSGYYHVRARTFSEIIEILCESCFIGDPDRLQNLKNSLDGIQSFSGVRFFHVDDSFGLPGLKLKHIDTSNIGRVSGEH